MSLEKKTWSLRRHEIDFDCPEQRFSYLHSRLRLSDTNATELNIKSGDPIGVIRGGGEEEDGIELYSASVWSNTTTSSLLHSTILDVTTYQNQCRVRIPSSSRSKKNLFSGIRIYGAPRRNGISVQLELKRTNSNRTTNWRRNRTDAVRLKMETVESVRHIYLCENAYVTLPSLRSGEDRFEARVLHTVPSSTPETPIFVGAKTTVTVVETSAHTGEDRNDKDDKDDDVAGSLTRVATRLAGLLTLPMQQRDAVRRSGLSEMLPRGVLLSGPSGVGKTAAVRAAVRAARRCGIAVDLLVASCDSASASGGGGNDAEIVARLREIFEDADARAVDGRGVIVLCEDIDVLCPSRQRNEESSSVGRRVALMLTLMDGFSKRDRGDVSGRVLVVGTTRDASAIDEALRRPGRLDVEIAIAPPSVDDRVDILAHYARRARLRFEPEFVRSFATRRCAGYVGADLRALVREAALLVTSDRGHTTAAALDAAAVIVGGSLARGKHTVVPPPTSWDAVAGLGDVKIRIEQAVAWPTLHPDAFRRMGLRPSRGILLFGPPGCAKTSLVRAAASTSGATLLCLNGADVFSPYVGESEATLRRAFARARSSLPAILFLDEIEAIVGRRDGGGGGGGDGNRVQQRIVTTLLTEMDGVASADGLVVIGATNRPDLIDEALRRPGRFDRMLYVPPPENVDQCLAILRVHTKRMLVDDADLVSIATACFERELTGAEIRGVCQRAALAALRESTSATRVRRRHFAEAIREESAALSSSSSNRRDNSGGGRFAWYERMRVELYGDTAAGRK